MRIAIIADYIDDQYAGTYVFAKEFISALERNNEAHTIVYIHLKENPFFKGLNEMIIPLRVNSSLLIALRKFILIPWILRRHRIDILHDLCHMAPFAFFGGRYKKVVSIHDITSLLFPEWHVKTNYLAHKVALPFVLRKADLVITNSAYTKKDISDHFYLKNRIEPVLLAARTETIPRETAKNFLKKQYGIDSDFILYVGTLEPRKNVPMLFEVFRKLMEEKGFDGYLILVGKKGWHFRKLKEAYLNVPGSIRRNIIPIGYIPENELPYFYSSASVFLFPSFYEGFGLPPLEAMTSGCPVVAADNSSLKEVVQGGGVLLPLENVDRWVEVVHRILSKKNYRNELIRNGLRQSKKFNWDLHAKRIFELYDELFAS